MEPQGDMAAARSAPHLPPIPGVDRATLYAPAGAIDESTRLALYRLMIRGARWLRLQARLLALESAPEAVTADARRPVLFLRAFAHEQVPLRAARIPRLVRTFDPGT